ncbi:MAG TPA: MCE family protein, partial [Bordetella sp.]|nr:MCE family protein [Bordetella sp.]
RSLREIAFAASRLSNETLPAVSGMANQVNATARNVSSTVRRVGDTPQSIIFGAPPPRPGPGEAGFQGFGRSQ